MPDTTARPDDSLTEKVKSPGRWFSSVRDSRRVRVTDEAKRRFWG